MDRNPNKPLQNGHFGSRLAIALHKVMDIGQILENLPDPTIRQIDGSWQFVFGAPGQRLSRGLRARALFLHFFAQKVAESA